MNRTTNRRNFLQVGLSLASGSLLDLHPLGAAEALPQSVAELWADFDPRQEPLEVELIREWKEDGGVFRLVRFKVGTFKGRPARMAALYGFPAGSQQKHPAVMHIHGGGQRAFIREVKLLVGRGYAALSVNWGGSGTGKPPFNACETALADDPNTDWGNVDPSQLNVPGYDSLRPGPLQFYEDREHPKNCNWYLLTLGCRRGLTFLEQQPEVNPQRLGVHGYSMGGNLTMYVAGTDDRVRAAVPAVGGQGWRWEAHDFHGTRATPQNQIQGSVELFRRTLSFESYAPRIQCPVLHRSATNDFHGWMDDVYRTNALIPNQPVRYSWVPHMNHQLSPEVAVTMPLWFDHYLKGGPALPQTPRTELQLKAADGAPCLRVVPDVSTLPAARVEVYYSVEADPRARFWRSAEVTHDKEGYRASLPLHTHDRPLYAFANVYHTLPKPESLAALPGNAQPVTEVCISSLFHSRSVAEVQVAAPALTAQVSRLVDDFAHGWRDWYVLNRGNLTHQQFWTRKLSDPLWAAPTGAKLVLTLQMPQTNSLSVVLQQNEWRSYRGPKRTFVCQREVLGAAAEQTLTLELKDFTSPQGPPSTWAEMDQLGLCAHFGGSVSEAKLWQGPAPQFLRVEWQV